MDEGCKTCARILSYYNAAVRLPDPSAALAAWIQYDRHEARVHPPRWMRRVKPST